MLVVPSPKSHNNLVKPTERLLIRTSTGGQEPGPIKDLVNENAVLKSFTVITCRAVSAQGIDGSFAISNTLSMPGCIYVCEPVKLEEIVPSP